MLVSWEWGFNGKLMFSVIRFLVCAVGEESSIKVMNDVCLYS